MTLKKIFGWFHLWIGLIIGLVVVISFFPAAIFVWDSELTDWYHSDKVFVPEVKSAPLPLSELFKMAQRAFPERRVDDVQISHEPDRSYVFTNYKKSDNPGWTWMSEMDYYDEIYVDQYSGKVLGRIDKRYDWIFMTRMLHQCLLLRYEVGHLFVSVATLAIFVMIITGLVLWWPKNKAALKQRFSIKWNAKWRRVNYDIHNVGGFYTYFFIFVLAVTGLVWSFNWWKNGIYRMLGNDPKQVWEKHQAPVLGELKSSLPIDLVLNDLKQKRDTWFFVSIGLPENISDSSKKEIYGSVRFNNGTGWDEWDTYFYHPESGALIADHLHEDKTLGAKWRNSNYAIHVGSIYGLPTKILMCFAALFCAFLPVTGFMIWYGRRNKKPIDQKAVKNPQLNVQGNSRFRI